MRPRRSIVGTLFGAELRMLLRDRRTLVTSVLLPLMTLPLMLLGSSWVVRHREQKLQRAEYHYAVKGSQAVAVRELMAAVRERVAAHQATNHQTSFQFSEIVVDDPDAALAQGQLHLVLAGLTPQEIPSPEPVPAEKPPGPGRTSTRSHLLAEDDNRPRRGAAPDGTWVVQLVFRGDRDDSIAGTGFLKDALRETRSAQRIELLRQRDFPLATAQIARLTEVNLATKGQVAGLRLGQSVTLFLLLFILAGGAVAATDILAGEKERGTLETLLTTAASRTEIIAAKFLAILAVALGIVCIQAGNLLVYIGFRLLPVPADLAAALPPATALLLFVLFLPIASLAASVLLLTSGYAKSYKEAQMFLFPIFLLGLLPAMAPFLPGLPLRSAIVIVPVANLALAIKEILIGWFDWPMIILSWLVTLAAALWVLRRAVKSLSAEKLVAAVDTDAVEFGGGPALFERQVKYWFAALWGVLVLVSNYTAHLDIRVVVLINLLVLFAGTSLGLLWRYRLDPRQALALRMPRPAVWLAVLIGAPGGLLSGVGLFRLADFVLPVSPKLIEAFNQLLFPENVPLGQIVLLLALLPGVVEEITFRGLLLHGLRHRFHPVGLVVVVGLVFGLFHVDLFRLASTAFLGILFGITTLLTGSIFPAMLWHVLNNLLAILTAKYQIPLIELNPGSYLIGLAFLTITFTLLWRNRTPYPDLRKKPPRANG